MVRRGQVQPLLDGFEENGIRYMLQTYDTTDPTSDDVERGYKTYKENGCKAIVAIGGGSRIDCAKGIAAKAVHPKKTVAQLQPDFCLVTTICLSIRSFSSATWQFHSPAYQCTGQINGSAS